MVRFDEVIQRDIIQEKEKRIQKLVLRNFNIWWLIGRENVGKGIEKVV